MIYRLNIIGDVVGQHRPRFTRTGRTYTLKEDRGAMRAIAREFECAYPGIRPTDRPCSVLVETWRKLPKSRPKRIAQEDDTFKPDCDNVAKLVLDALNGIAWTDDKQVFELHVVKHPRERRADELMRVVIEVL